MADIQHKNITDPNLHEPKGVKFAEANTAYIADGTGSGSWETVLLMSDITASRYQVFSFTGNTTSTLNNTLFPLTYTEEALEGDALVSASGNMLTFLGEGKHYINFLINISININVNQYRSSFNHVSKIQLTNSSSAYSAFSPLFGEHVASYKGTNLVLDTYGNGNTREALITDYDPVINGRSVFFKNIVEGSQMGLWVSGSRTGSAGVAPTSVSGYVQIIKGNI